MIYKRQVLNIANKDNINKIIRIGLKIMQLDGIDKQILKELYDNGRESLTNLEKKIFKSGTETMSHAGIAKRISKLEDTGILKIQANTSFDNLNYKIAIILMEMSNYDEVQKVIKSYEDCPRVFLLAHVTGQYNLILGIIGQSIEVLHRYINFCGPTNKKGILHTATIFVSELVTPKFFPIDLFSQKSQEEKCGNICVDCVAYLDGKCGGCGNF